MANVLSALFVGSDTLLLQCLEAWRERGHGVAAVVTDAEKVRRFCAEHGLPCHEASAALWDGFAAGSVDCTFAITWLRLLPEAALRVARLATVNFHDGPLPRYAGLNATCWAIAAGESKHGVTWHEIEREADTGAILLQREFPIAADDTAFTLNARCFQLGLETFGELADGLAAGAIERRLQDRAARTWFGRHARPAALAVLDFAAPAATVARVVRAFDHGGYRNPIAIGKVRAMHGVFVPHGVEVLPGSGRAPGTVTALGDEFVQVACGDGELRLTKLRCLRGSPLSAAALGRLGVVAGSRLPLLSAADAAALTALGKAAAPSEDAWVAMLAAHEPLPVPGGAPGATTASPATVPVDLPGAVDGWERAALLAAFLARLTAKSSFTLGVRTGATEAAIAGATDLAVASAPCAFEFAPDAAVGGAVAAATAALRAHERRGPLLRELLVRRHDVLAATTVLEPPVRIAIGAPAREVAPGTIEFAIDAAGVMLHYDAAALPPAAAQALAARCAVFARAAAANPAAALAAVPVLDERELRTLLHEWNATAAPAPTEIAVHRQFESMAQARPEHVALRCRGQIRTYRELAGDVARLAGFLRARGVQPGDRVGICVRRGFGMVAAVLAAMRCGAAYVPLDPSYPRERLQFMADDAGLKAIVIDAATAATAPDPGCARVDLDADAAAIVAATPLAAEPAGPEQLAYVIYTSGSTGRPKGVMVRHRNVANFFAGMDRVLGTEPGVWLAVTSLSFDISVLELLWTLCRGFTVVVHTGETAAAVPAPVRPVSFSLFYFASDEGEHAQDKYRLLLDGARFADEQGFEAVWTPERHFHAFGGLYPNPAVASAAIAVVTKNVAIRAGSCVVTLHHPIRVAEDFALVDNLSRGRVGIAFAAGWHARDFVLRPETFADRKAELFRSLRTVQALWRGETIPFRGPDGKEHAIRTLPRPVQKELPTWVTIAGNPETYRQAGEAGAFVLTHLLGQSTDELAHKLAVYRAAWRAAGHPGEGRVTLMLHTFVGDDDAEVKEIVRGPMKEYLRSSLDLVKQAAWSFPAFKQRVAAGDIDALLQGGLSPADFEALLDFSFERYHGGSGLFGTVATCAAMVDRLRGMGVDEIACLIDFGVPTDLVMQSLPKLAELRRRCSAQAAPAACAAAPPPASAESIPELLRAHQVTHFQCTPSMAGMLLLDPAGAPALRGLRHMLVGGEALSTALARQLRSLVGTLHDVYGPTETTVWSTTMPVGDDDPVPIGRPLANQRVYVLDANLQPVAIGEPGELWIGGAGVAAGYWRRPELTAERFRPDPWLPGGTMYGTGDVVRWRRDGVLEYLGRKDHQVKVRGYRIELGEIEAALLRHPGVRESVVVARPVDGGDAQLVAYWTAREAAPKADELRAHLRGALPEFMVPSHFVLLAELPRTPNLKVDRKALPAPDAVVQRRQVAAAQDDTEGAILAIWKQALGTDDVGVEDNFFDSGGHSILAVRVHRELVQRFGVPLQVTDLFRFTTVRALAKHLRGGSGGPTAAQQAAERAKQRRGMLRRT